MTSGVQLLERRQKMLRDYTLGIDKPEIFRSLASEYEVSYDAIYRDFKNRAMWQADVLDIKDSKTLALDVVTLLNWLKRRGVMEVMQADNSNARIGAIRTVADIATRIYNIIKDLVPEQEEVTQDDITKLLDEYKDIYEMEEGYAQPLQEVDTGEQMDTP